ncbi:enoyl-CoA hydratase-related protein [Aquibium sp. A9E412]|uniref:enoyl-CoA hydratase-related protein n=1 Tax=Aquibium sp. A9E412 TaxID=2976767 RepID=UPI0025B01975|nr:enoyl-CoA hydratase-related protein [Aquibium sp. A9E412]MDN2565592.1 enoyl-CoA hydratase-related protein [Aquibium sp. A9E412]
MDGAIRLERDGAVATVTMDRPAKHNALTLAMYEALGAAMRELSDDDTVRCVILRGAGERAFCAGSDIGDFDDTRSGVAQAKEYARRSNAAIRTIRDCPHPVVAAIGGICIGGGMEIASMCDLRIASDDSRFGLPAARLGLTVDYDELAMLVDLAGRRGALEILLEGHIFGAEEALRHRLVTRIVPRAELAAAVAATVERVTAGAPRVNRWHKAFVRRLEDPAPLDAAERDEAFACYDTEDYREGSRAFAEKRRPDFKGR